MSKILYIEIILNLKRISDILDSTSILLPDFML